MTSIMMKTIGIFPASGRLGTSTYKHLLNLVPASSVVLISRYPEKIPKSYRDKPDGVAIRQASYESSPQELRQAFGGIDVLFLISYPSHVHEYRTKVQLPALDAAHAAGVSYIFYSSLAFALPDNDASKAVVMQAHLDCEAHLRQLAAVDGGFSWTAIREGLYAESFPVYTSFFDIESPATEIRIPHDGTGPGVSWVKRDELGEATARLIAQCADDTKNFGYRNQRMVLTGPRSMSLSDTTDALGRVSGRPGLRIQEISVDEYVKLPQVQAKYGDEEMARSWATAWEAIKDGEAAYVSPTLAKILGREPASFEEAIKQLRGDDGP